MSSNARPALQAENALIAAILDGRYPPGCRLPGERELASLLGVTRPTLRETLSRLARDGWLTIRHGKSTLVNDYWNDGGLNVLSTIVRFGRAASDNTMQGDFVTWLLEVRLALAPAYTCAAVAANPSLITTHLNDAPTLPEDPATFAAFDWQLHHLLARASENPVFTLILNGFKDLYAQVGQVYFSAPAARTTSRAFYAALNQACRKRAPDEAAQICRETMAESVKHWLNKKNALLTTHHS